MTIAIFLYIYYIIVLCFVVFSLFIVYHLFRFGVHSIENFLLLFVYVSVSILILFATYYFAVQIDWSLPIFNTGFRLPTTL